MLETKPKYRASGPAARSNIIKIQSLPDGLEYEELMKLSSILSQFGRLQDCIYKDVNGDGNMLCFYSSEYEANRAREELDGALLDFINTDKGISVTKTLVTSL